MDDLFEDAVVEEKPLMVDNSNNNNEPQKKSKKPLWIVLIVLACLVVIGCSVTIGIFIGAKQNTFAEDMPLMIEAYEYMKKYYYKDISWNEFQELATAAMVDQLDPFTSMIGVAQSYGSSKRFGFTLTSDMYNYHRVSRIVPNSPADRAYAYQITDINTDKTVEVKPEDASKYPLEIGDRLVGISYNGTEIAIEHLDTLYMNQFIANNTDSIVKLRFVKYNYPTFIFDYLMEKELFEDVTAYYYSPSEIATEEERQDVGMIVLTGFDINSTPQDFVNAIDQFLYDEENPSKLIIDLRGNGGGDGEVLKFIANFFISNYKESLLMEFDAKNMKGDFEREKNFTRSTYDFNGEELQSFYLGDKREGFEVVALCDGGTASSAEILLHNIIFYNNAKAVGQKTFGKGVGQRVFPMSNGRDSLVLTAGKYYLPSHFDDNGNAVCDYNIHGVGISPLPENIISGEGVVQRPLKDDRYIRRALELFS